ncbi:MAG: DNA internalization-related competence protein ComEC/Rec2 [Deltaproteobacteria bacterium]|nr:DNA internalization-related competence protein ComEC/Rec2 [Deltaproteobacteria bacterium]
MSSRSEVPRVRASAAAVALALGIAAERGLGGGGAWWFLAAIAVVVAARTAHRASILLAIAALGGGLAARGAPEPIPGVDDRRPDTITGTVTGPIVRGKDTDRVVIATATGPIGAWVARDRLRPGDVVRATGRLVAPRGYRNPGGIDRAQAARDAGITAGLILDHVEVVDHAFSPWAWAVDAQRAGAAAIAARGGDPVGNAIVRGAVLGDRSAIPEETDAIWRTAGVVHVLSVSGLHLAIVALIGFALIGRLLGLWLPSRVSRALAAGLAIVLAVAYTAVTGWQVATVRALVVAVLMLAGAAVGRRPALIDALGAAAIAILVQRPSALGDPSFQLSFTAAIALAYGGLLRGPAPSPHRLLRILRWLGRAIATSALVTAITAPISAYHFHQLGLASVIGNLLVTPLVELIAIPLALFGAILTAISSTIGGPLIDLSIAACGLADRIAAVIASAIPAVAVAPIGIVASAAWIAGIAAIAAALGRRLPSTRASLIVAAAAALIALAGAPPSGPPAGGARIAFLDVGQGDAAVGEVGDQVWLGDAGGEPGADLINGGPGAAVVRYLAARRIDHIDVAIVSHPHPDHYLGLLAVAARVPIGELWSADEVEPRTIPTAPGQAMPRFDEVAAALVARGTRWVHPALGPHALGPAIVRVLAPHFDPGDGARAIATADPVVSVNDASLVIALEVAGRRVLFPGDLEEEGETTLIARVGAWLPSEVVKVPHHGSPTSSSAAFVAATHPRWAIASLGVANRFGFPSPAVVARWQAAGATVLRTDQRGAVTVEIDGAGAMTAAAYDP